MPRVNRDLQRRMAARRERERRRPGDRRYQFAPPAQPAVEPDEPFGDGAPLAEDAIDEDVETDGGLRTQTAPPRGPRTTLTRASRGVATRPAPRPFTAYRDEYRYVIGDLRRILLVVGSLLVVLIVLWLVLPR